MVASKYKKALPLNIFIAVAGLGLSPLAKKAALSAGAAPLPLALAAVLIGAVCVFGYARTQNARVLGDCCSRSTLVHLFFIGAMGSGAVTLLSVLALTETTATNRSLFQAMYPVATAVCARFMLGEKLKPVVYWVIVLMSVGLFLMNRGDAGLKLGGAFWMLAATLPLIGLADVYAKRTLGDTNPEVVALGRLLFGGLALLPVVFWTPGSDWIATGETGSWVIASGVAIAGGVIGLYRSLNVASASITAALISLAPVLTALAEWLILGSRFSWVQLAGVGLVVSGAATLALKR